MIFNWLNRQDDANKVIVFFNGWGLGDAAVEHLALNSQTDILLVSDYTSLDADLPDLSAYQQRYLIAWSFGVANYAAWQFDHKQVFDKKIAISGTMQGIDRKRGIASKVVQHTIDKLSLASFKEFIHRCYNDQISASAKQLIDITTEIDIDTKKIELQSINDRNYANIAGLEWDTIWISQQDKIFPTLNQQLAWQGKQTKIINTAHAPFGHWLSWQDIINSQ